MFKAHPICLPVNNICNYCVTTHLLSKKSSGIIILPYAVRRQEVAFCLTAYIRGIFFLGRYTQPWRIAIYFAVKSHIFRTFWICDLCLWAQQKMRKFELSAIYLTNGGKKTWNEWLWWLVESCSWTLRTPPLQVMRKKRTLQPTETQKHKQGSPNEMWNRG